MINQEAILKAIRDEPGLTNPEIRLKCGISWFSNFYAVLLRLEHRKLIRGEWVTGPYPRKRRYYPL